MDQPTDKALIARAYSAWYQAGGARAAPVDPDPRASTVEEIDGLRYIVLRTPTDGTAVAVYRIVPANLTTPVRLRLMKRPPAALTTS